jgi:hypothetical protein
MEPDNYTDALNGSDSQYFGNHSGNSTYEDDVFDPWGTLGWAAPLILTFTFMGLFMNTLTIISIVKSKDLFKQTAFALLAGQAMTDLSVGVTSFLYYLVFVQVEGTFGGAIGCNVFAWMMFFSCYATLGSLSIIAHSRRVIILRNKPVDRKMFLKMFAFWAWFVPVVMANLFFGAWGFYPTAYNTFCNPRYNVTNFLTLLFTSTPHMAYMSITYFSVSDRLLPVAIQYCWSGC